ncbi:hypothetical protein POL68_41630 [Stigmatella sp. ncwal1]|uniref:Phosphate-selective porin O and P n=1 Tax=Stigmatella ashevillensis TaxID=2995309 RepID=A0ABT5DN44_9BACT|nr:hypothetical protein [Stigmatella ashevillena]MDC0715024.1 hypothetical protein [Stigmatella ashevillena]
MRSASFFAVLLYAATVLADPPAPLGGGEEKEAQEEKALKRPRLEFKMSGYGDLQFTYYNYGENQNRVGGSQRDSRMTFDTTRLALELEAELPDYGLEAEIEVEFEHGGTGSSMELEYEEFGEFEMEVEKGGEVMVEELVLKKKFGKRFSLAIGRFYVAVGTLSAYSRPTDYLATVRSEAETLILPNTWHEMGLQAKADLGLVKLTAQAINGLDSTAFNSQRWVAEGHQLRFEMVRARDMAMVLRADVERFEGLVFGVSGYYGGTTRNRPKPDLVKACEDADSRQVAPCGYVSAGLLILDAHLSLQKGPWRAKALVLWGNLQNADDISARNARLSNFLNVTRTPVAEHALAIWAELGRNVSPLMGLNSAHKVEPYVRFDYVDSQFNPRAELFDNPRFARAIYTVGAAYTLADLFFAKFDFGHRRLNDASRFRPENTLRLSTGFSYN